MRLLRCCIGIGLSGVVNAHHVRSMPPFVRLITSDAHALPPDRAWTDGAAQTKKKKANRSVLRPGASGPQRGPHSNRQGWRTFLPTHETNYYYHTLTLATRESR
jgi:hypothetical protein